jgi:hypothetical protein
MGAVTTGGLIHLQETPEGGGRYMVLLPDTPEWARVGTPVLVIRDPDNGDHADLLNRALIDNYGRTELVWLAEDLAAALRATIAQRDEAQSAQLWMVDQDELAAALTRAERAETALAVLRRHVGDDAYNALMSPPATGDDQP